MGLETATTIEDLDPTWPTGNDSQNQGDDHIRLTKSVLKNQFPGSNGNGLNAPILVTEIEFNYLQGLDENIQVQINNIVNALNANSLGVTPVGGVILWNGVAANVPANWQICDGTNGTPDLVDKMAKGANSDGDLGTSGGYADSQLPAHTHTVVADGDHQHAGAGAHSHGSAGDHGHASAGSHSHPSAGSHTHNGFVNRGSGANGVADMAVSADGTWKVHGSAGDHQHAAAGDHTHANAGAHTHPAVGNHQHASAGSHTHTVNPSGVNSTDRNYPPYAALYYIQRMA